MDPCDAMSSNGRSRDGCHSFRIRYLHAEQGLPKALAERCEAGLRHHLLIEPPRAALRMPPLPPQALAPTQEANG